MTSSEMLARLRAPGTDSYPSKLAALIVDDVLARRIDALVDPKVLAAAARDALRAMTASDAAEAHIVARAKEIVADLATETRSVASIVPAALADGARAIVALPMTPRHDAVMGLLDREPVKNLLRAQVVETLVAFGRRAASPVSDNAIARGIGGFSKLVASRPSALGRMASAVSGEVEKQVEKRANDFADTAVAGVLESIAEQASDPARAKDQAAMRAALLDGLLELAPSEIAATAAGHEAAQVAIARKALRAWSNDAAFVAEVEAALTKVVARDATRTLGEVLGDLGLRDAAAAHARAEVERILVPVVSGDAFAKWLADLCGE